MAFFYMRIIWQQNQTAQGPFSEQPAEEDAMQEQPIEEEAAEEDAIDEPVEQEKPRSGQGFGW